MAGAGVLIATAALKVVLTIPKVVLIVPIYVRSIDRHDERIKKALNFLEAGENDKAAEILAEFSVDVINEMWNDFLLLCRGVWRTRITEKPLWMLGTAYLASFPVKWTWEILSMSWAWTIGLTVGSVIAWFIYKVVKEYKWFQTCCAWCSARFNAWQKKGSDWVLDIAHEQEDYESLQAKRIASGEILPPKKMTWERIWEMIINVWGIEQALLSRLLQKIHSIKS